MRLAIHVANPHEAPRRWGHAKLNSDGRRFLFGFGTHGATFVLVWSQSLEEALAIAAEFLLEQKWFGLITPHDRPLEELGCDCADPFECEAHTYTESGWLASYEWTVDEPICNADLRRIHRG